MRSGAFSLVLLLGIGLALSPALTRATRAQSIADHVLPDPRKTPGKWGSATKDDLCPVAHTPKLRNVPESLKHKVYVSYGTLPHQGFCQSPEGEGCEVDHLVSLELGGTNDQDNLWPEPYVGIWNAHMKDKLENKLHSLVCDGTLELSEAQRAISTDWVAAFRRYVGPG